MNAGACTARRWNTCGFVLNAGGTCATVRRFTYPSRPRMAERHFSATRKGTAEGSVHILHLASIIGQILWDATRHWVAETQPRIDGPGNRRESDTLCGNSNEADSLDGNR